MFLLNSRLGLFVATALRLSCFHKITATAPLLPKLRGHFAEFLNESYLNALVFSTHPPVSVYGTITSLLARGFSSQRRISETCLFTKIDMPITFQSNDFADFPTKSPYALSVEHHLPRSPIFLRHPITQTLKVVQEYLTCFPSPTPFGLGLGYRLTLSG